MGDLTPLIVWLCYRLSLALIVGEVAGFFESLGQRANLTQ
jgi:hypothetical protein